MKKKVPAKNIIFVFSLFVAGLFCYACIPPKTISLTKTVFAMDTVMTLSASGKNAEAALEQAEKEIFRLDALLNRHDEDSTLSLLNRSGMIDNEELSDLLTRSVQISKDTYGTFDCTLAPLIDIWNVSGGGHIPSTEEINSNLTLIGAANRIQIDGPRIILAPGTQLDLGGAGKGYAGERLRAIYEEYGVTGSISLGGDDCLVGQKSPDSPLWRVGIRMPWSDDSIIGIIHVTDTFIVTSGAYERYFTDESGVVYHHILDPQTGMPAQNGLVSATVLTKDGVLADALATAFFVMGLEKAENFLYEHPEVSAILITDTGKVLYSAALSETFTPQSSAYQFETF